MTFEERFWAKVEKTEACWLWKGCIRKDGYGAANASLAHRLAYKLTKGSIPEGLALDHLCRVRACVNPAHLEPVTLRENILRGAGLSAIHARKTHCLRGHRYNRANTYHYLTRQHRVCRECRKIWDKRRTKKV